MSSKALLLALSVLVAVAAEKKPFNGEYHEIWDKTKVFHPEKSSSFQLIRKEGVDLKYLDKTHLQGADGQDFVSVGPYYVNHRFALITQCNKPICLQVDGILGFGNMYHDRNPSLLDTLSRDDRPDWDIVQPFDFIPMPRRFAFTATDARGELQLGGYDPLSIEEGQQMVYFPAKSNYQVQVKSITYGNGPDALELLQWNEGGGEGGESGEGGEGGKAAKELLGKLDSGSSCILIPSSTLGGALKESPYELLGKQELAGVQRSLFFTMVDEDGVDRTFEIEYNECVQGTPTYLLFGDPWFRRYVVDHDYRIKDRPRIGVALRAAKYDLQEEIDEDYLEAFSTDEEADEDRLAGSGYELPLDDGNGLEDSATDPDQAQPSTAETGVTESKTGARVAKREVGDGSGPPIGLAPAKQLESRKHRKQPLRNWRTESMWAHSKRGESERPAKIGARRMRASADEAAQLASLFEWPSPGVEKVRLEGHRVIYTIPIGIGTPEQMKNVIFDTGSYMLAVWSDPPSTEAVEESEIHQAVGASTAGQPIQAYPSDPHSAWTMELLQVRSAAGERAIKLATWSSVVKGACLGLVGLVMALVVVMRRRSRVFGERTPMLG